MDEQTGIQEVEAGSWGDWREKKDSETVPLYRIDYF